MFDITTLPTNPGCYLFRDTNKKIIYVGKAKNLRKRVKSYFQKKGLDPKTRCLIDSFDSVEFFVTDTEVEALILENTLIKKHQPKYNINLKDAKTYAFIQLTDEEFPRLVIARKKSGNGRFYGPFLNRTFSLRTCKKMPKKPCLRHHISLCDAPCGGLISKQEYANKIMNAQLALSGKSGALLKKMDLVMKEKSKQLEFEKALTLRNQKIAIQHLQEHQNMQRHQTYDEDIINYMIREGTVYLMLFTIYKGTLSNKNEYVFEYNDDFLEEFIVQYYSENPVPKEMIVPSKVTESVISFLEQKRKKRVHVLVPKKGAKKQLLDLVKKNIEISFFADITKIDELQKRLQLQETPFVIECFDISHLSGTSTVGSMVQFRKGKPDKSNYRRFRIRTVVGVDDVAAISEVVRRRYARLKQEHAEMPHLIIIDGGRGQLNGTVHELEKLDVKIPVISIAKQFEEIYLPGSSQPVRLAKKEKALLFIQEIRDEAHRFAISYNRLLRRKKLRE